MLARAIGLHAEVGAGLLLHAALAVWEGNGVLLAAQSGQGKTTASRRLPAPWRSWCDDTTLIVRDGSGRYWGHPWPTYRKVLPARSDATWNAEQAAPIRAVFFLAQSEVDGASPLAGAQAVGRLNESAEQVSGPLLRRMAMTEVRRHRVRRLDNIGALAEAVPCYELHVSLTGAFWQEMEHALLERAQTQ